MSKKKKEAVATPGEYIALINSRDRENEWLVYPYLPLRRPEDADDPNLQLALIWSGENAPGQKQKLVRLAALFMIPDTIQEWKQLPVIAYDSAEAMLEAGWVVD